MNWTRVLVIVLVVWAALAGAEVILNDDSDDNESIAGAYGEVVTYSIEYHDGARNVDGAVADALVYWELNSEYVAGDVQFAEVASADDAELVIELVDGIDSCGVQHHTLISGCAPIVESEENLPATIQVEASHPIQHVRDTTKHEIGHALGLTHADEPQRIMSAQLPLPEERAELLVHMHDDVPREEVRRGLDWLVDHPDAAVERVRLVDNEIDADLVIRPLADDEIFIDDTVAEVYGGTQLTFQYEPGSEYLDWYLASTLGELYFEGSQPPELTGLPETLEK